MRTEMKEGRAPRPGYGWVVMGLFWALNAGAFGLIQSLGILLPRMGDDLALGSIDFAWLGSIYFLTMCLLSVPLSSWLSRYEPNRLVTVSALLGGLLIFAQGWAPSFAVAMASRLAFAVLIIARFPAGPLLIQRWFPPQRISLVNAVAMVSIDATLALSLTMVPFLITLLGGWRNTYYAFGVYTILAGLAWLAFGGRRPNSQPRPTVAARESTPLWAAFRYKEIWMLGIGVFGVVANWAALATFWPTYAGEEYDLPLTRAGFLLGLGSVGSVIGYLLCSPLSARVGRRKPLIVLPGLILPLVNFAMLGTGSVPLLAMLSLLRGLTWMFMPLVMTVPYELPGIKPREVAVATAMVMTLTAGGGAVGPLLAGVLATSLGSLYLALALTCILPITLVIVGLLLPETGRKARGARRPKEVV